MNNAVNLRDLIDEMDTQMEDYYSYVHTKSGKIITIERSILNEVEEEEIEIESIQGWEKEIYENAFDIVENYEDYVPLPTEWDINEYEIMEKFIDNLEKETVRDQLYRAIRGSGAFRRFKDTIIRLNVDEDWYKFKEERLKEIAIEFCEENDISYTDR